MQQHTLSAASRLLCAAACILIAACGSTSTKTDHQVNAADAAARGSDSAANSYAREGFLVELEDGRLWVQRPGQKREEKHVAWIGAGPDGMTVKAPDAETALAYVASRPGFVVEVEDGRLWVLRSGQQKDEKNVTKIGAGPRGATVRANDKATLDAYLALVGK